MENKTLVFIEALHEKLDLHGCKCDVNKVTTRGASPLFVALQNRHLKCVEILLTNGADPNCCTDDGTSALSVAIFDVVCTVLRPLPLMQ